MKNIVIGIVLILMCTGAAFVVGVAYTIIAGVVAFEQVSSR